MLTLLQLETKTGLSSREMALIFGCEDMKGYARARARNATTCTNRAISFAVEFLHQEGMLKEYLESSWISKKITREGLKEFRNVYMAMSYLEMSVFYCVHPNGYRALESTNRAVSKRTRAMARVLLFLYETGAEEDFRTWLVEQPDLRAMIDYPTKVSKLEKKLKDLKKLTNELIDNFVLTNLVQSTARKWVEERIGHENDM